MLKDRAARVGLPPRPFLYTLDQISGLVDITVGSLKRQYIFYVGRSVGAAPDDKMEAVNIAPDDEKPDWRVSEGELVRWMRLKGFRYYERGWLDDGSARGRRSTARR